MSNGVPMTIPPSPQRPMQTTTQCNTVTYDAIPPQGCRHHRAEGWCDVDGIIFSSIREGTATFLFVMISLAVASNDLYDRGFLAIADAFAYAAVSFTFGGALCNPALSLAAAVGGKLRLKAMLAHIVSQLAGALLGAVCVRWGLLLDVDFALPFLVTGSPWWVGLLAEFLFTYAISLFVLTAIFADWSGIRPVLVGLGLGAAVFATGPITTGSLNPWKALSAAIVLAKFEENCWIFFVIPFAGGLVAGIMSRILHIQHLHMVVREGIKAT